MPSERQRLFPEGPIGRALLRLAVPIILGNLLQTGYQAAGWKNTRLTDEDIQVAEKTIAEDNISAHGRGR